MSKEYSYPYPMIHLLDGSTEWVGGDTDAYFQRIVKEHLGDEAEAVYESLRDDWLENLADDGDEDNAEAEAWRNYAIDVWHELQEIVYAKRINRKKLLALVERMEGDL